jgi:adenosylcobinamide-phosphate synthase
VSVVVAGVLDRALAEPPLAVHPVAWTGRYLDRAAALVAASPRRRAMASGGAAWLLGAGAAVGVAAVVDRLAARGGRLLGAAVRGVALWPLLSVRMLLDEVAAVEAAVTEDAESGRRALARIVSRDTCDLTPAQVRAAAIESLAENLSDSVVAPLVWYAVAGLPGAALHRYANTADACWGYRTERWQYAGRVAARADDALNLVPARLTALLLAPRAGGRLAAEAARTASPNAGWPMAAMALRLDLALAKPDHYILNPQGSTPTATDMASALRAARRAALVALVSAALVEHLARPRPGGRP